MFLMLPEHFTKDVQQLKFLSAKHKRAPAHILTSIGLFSLLNICQAEK